MDFCYKKGSSRGGQMYFRQDKLFKDNTELIFERIALAANSQYSWDSNSHLLFPLRFIDLDQGKVPN